MLVVKAFLLAAAISVSSLLGSLSGSGGRPCEHAVTEIPLSAGLERSDAEISGLTWFGDELVLLPQYPARLGGHVFAMRRDDITAWLDAGGLAPVPRPVPITPTGLEADAGFEGLEAIAFHGDSVFVSIELEGSPPAGVLMRGRVVGDLERIELDPTRQVRVRAEANIENLSYEAITVTDDRVMLFYETNGRNNPEPRVRVFDHDLVAMRDLSLARVEYRITDVTAVDPSGELWALNYFWPGETWEPGACPLAARFGVGATHAGSRDVERLVPLRVRGHSVEPAGAPIQLRLDSSGGRNWEGIARLPGRGFLIVTDEHPRSILGFVSSDG